MANIVSDAYRKSCITKTLTNVFAMLVNDPANTLTADSTVANAADLEIAATGGYARQPVTVPTPTGTTIATATCGQVTWTPTGSAFGQFTKVVYICDGVATRANTTGTIIEWHDATNSPVNLQVSQPYKSTLSVSVNASAS